MPFSSLAAAARDEIISEPSCVFTYATHSPGMWYYFITPQPRLTSLAGLLSFLNQRQIITTTQMAWLKKKTKMVIINSN